MKHLYLISLLILCFAGCSQEAEPYEETNLTKPTSSETGYIQTH